MSLNSHAHMGTTQKVGLQRRSLRERRRSIASSQVPTTSDLSNGRGTRRTEKRVKQRWTRGTPRGNTNMCKQIGMISEVLV